MYIMDWFPVVLLGSLGCCTSCGSSSSLINSTLQDVATTTINPSTLTENNLATTLKLEIQSLPNTSSKGTKHSHEQIQISKIENLKVRF